MTERQITGSTKQYQETKRNKTFIKIKSTNRSVTLNMNKQVKNCTRKTLCSKNGFQIPFGKSYVLFFNKQSKRKITRSTKQRQETKRNKTIEKRKRKKHSKSALNGLKSSTMMPISATRAGQPYGVKENESLDVIKGDKCEQERQRPNDHCLLSSEDNTPDKSECETAKQQSVDKNKHVITGMTLRSKKVLPIHLEKSELNDVLKEFRQKHKKSLVRAHFAYKIDSPETFIILAYLNYPVKTKEWKMFKKFRVLFMDYLYVNTEATRVAVDKRALEIKLPESAETELRQSITKHADRLMSEHSNLEILSGSAVRSKQKGHVIEREICIVFFCRKKGYIPVGEVPFPQKIDGFSVDVREGYFQWSPSGNHLANEYQTYLKMGCSIGTKQSPVKGSLGGFVVIKKNLGFITCAHVVYNQDKFLDPTTIQPNKTIVVQPADGELPQGDTRDRKCGTVLRHAIDLDSDIGVECAVVTITKRKPIIAEFCDNDEESLRKAGFEPSNPLRYTTGKIIENPNQENYKDRRLIKCGRTTGLRRGTFEFNGAAVRVEEVHLGLDRSASTVLCLKGQYMVQSIGLHPFVEEGDSGAFVFLVEDDKSLSCIGMVEGMTTHFSSVVTPITEILKKLKLDQTKLHVFPEDLMETD